MKVEFVVTKWDSNSVEYRADTYGEAEQWIKARCDRANRIGLAEFQIHKVFTSKEDPNEGKKWDAPGMQAP